MNVNAILREIVQMIIMILVVLGITTLLTTYVAAPLVVDGSSMVDTLEDGERLWMLKLADIERFDVVVFPAPNDPESLYVKRVIGVPGDTIDYQNDQLLINGAAVEEPYLETMAEQALGNFTNDFTMEEITGTSVVPEGAYFVMGDNRRNSLDSRAFGFIEAESVIGEADMVYWPLDEIGLLDKWKLNEEGTAIVER